MKAIFILDEQDIKEIVTKVQDIEVDEMTEVVFDEQAKTISITIDDWS